MSLVEALANVVTDLDPTFQPSAGDWSLTRLRSTLDSYGLKYRERLGKLDIISCPLCGESEGNPAAWIFNGFPVLKCLRAKCNGKWADLQAKFTSQSRLQRISALDLPGMYPHRRPDVVTGLIRRGDVAAFVGGPKARKSFFLEQLAISVAAGIPFLQWETVPGKVLLIDNELRPDDLSRRLTKMVEAMGLEWGDVAPNIDIIPLRGRPADLYKIRDELASEPGRYTLVLLDAFYKCVPRGLDENSNSDMTTAYVLLDEAAERHDCGLAISHHLSKGNQANKSITDLGSGAGAQSRSVDAHLAMLPHADDRTVILQGVLRSQAPFAPVCLTFEHPIWKVAADKDPTAVACSQRKPVPSMEEFLATIPSTPGPKTEVIARARKTLGTSRATISLLLGQADSEGHVAIVSPSNRRQRTTICRKEQK